MPVFDLYSYRKRVAEGAIPDVLIYDELPETLRVQIIRIWRNAIGPAHVYSGVELGAVGENNRGWQTIHDTVAQEHGRFSLSSDANLFDRCQQFLLGASVNDALDIIEASFSYIDEIARRFRGHDRTRRGITATADDAINELNERFRRASVGYRFEDSKILRIDSELIHAEVVKPALRYLQHRGFEGPREEYLKAHAHYRAGETKDAITNANNALESTLKTICSQRSWEYPQGARASDLLRVVREKGLLPNYLDNSFDQLAATLKSGLPRVRNEEGGHGQGPTPRKTPDYVAAYALHLAAAKILFLCEAHKGMDW